MAPISTQNGVKIETIWTHHARHHPKNPPETQGGDVRGGGGSKIQSGRIEFTTGVGNLTCIA